MKPLAFNENTLIVGGPGTGKTLLGVQLALEDDSDIIATNIELFPDRVAEWCKDHDRANKIIIKVDKPSDLLRPACRCAAWLIDEAQQYWPARKSAKETDWTDIKPIYEHRKFDGRTILTCQMIRNLDLIPAGFCLDVIRMSKMERMPFTSWGRPWSLKPDMLCRWPNEEEVITDLVKLNVPKELIEAHKEDHVMRCGQGDTQNWLQRLLGISSRLCFALVDPEMIHKGRTLAESAQPEEDPAVIDTFTCPFDIRIANCYDSGQDVAKNALTRSKGQKGRKRTAKSDKNDGAAAQGGAAAPPPAPLPLPPF